MDPRKILIVAAVVWMAAGCSGNPPRHPAATARPEPVAVTSTTAAPVTTVTTAVVPTTTVPLPFTPPSSTTTANPPPTARAAAAATVPCPTTLAGQLRSTGTASQLITVVAAGWGTSAAQVQLWQKTGSCWFPAGGPWAGYIGANGFSQHHIEGDSTTPVGVYGVGSPIYGNQPDPGVREPYHQLVCGDWWDEDPGSPSYNTFQHVPCGQTPPFAGGSEALWKETAPYPSFAVIDYNTGPVAKGAGSAIFLHAATGTPTSGCVSIPLPDLDQALRWIDPARAPEFVMGPAGVIAGL